MAYDAEENYEKKKRNYELIKEAHKIASNNVSKKILEQAEDDLKFAIDMLKNQRRD